MLALSICALSFFSSQALASSSGSTRSDDNHWKKLGSRWATLNNIQGEVLEIHDLSYPEFSRGSNARSGFELGVVGEDLLKVSKLRSLFRAQLGKGDSKRREVIREAYDAVSKVSDGELNGGRLPKNWWRAVPWNNPAIARAGAPERFSLADVDLKMAAKSPDEFDHEWTEAVRNIGQASEGLPLCAEKLLESLVFERILDDRYRIRWVPLCGAGGARKVVDLVDLKAGYREALAWDATDKGVSFAIGLINIPVVHGLLRTAWDRLTHYQDLLIQSRQAMAIEMIHTAQDASGHGGAPFSPYSALSEAQQIKSKVYLMQEQTTLLSWIKWLFTDPLKQWGAQVAESEQTAQESTVWAADHDRLVEAFNPRFAITTDLTGDAGAELAVLSFSPASFSRLPYVSVRYASPDSVIAGRIATEASIVAMGMASSFIPVAGSVVFYAYKLIVQDPMTESKFWEARLSAHLGERISAGESRWERELSWLERQRINPFELMAEESRALVEARWDALGAR